MSTQKTSKSKGKKNRKVNKNSSDFYIECPWCTDIIYIEKVKCALFLHGFNNRTQRNIGPHTKRVNIEKIRNSGNLRGCGGRFKLVYINSVISALCVAK